MSTRPGSASALLVVDVQVGVVAEAFERARIVGNIALAVRKARAAGMPVIWVQHHNEGSLVCNSDAWQWAPELDPAESELCIHKRHNFSFEDTPLEDALDRLGVSHLILVGAATNWCIRATAYGALDRGYDLTLVSDAHTTKDMEIEPGRVVLARSAIDDLNIALRFLSCPDRRNAAVAVAELNFG